jgi:hypothetical protein
MIMTLVLKNYCVIDNFLQILPFRLIFCKSIALPKVEKCRREYQRTNLPQFSHLFHAAGRFALCFLKAVPNNKV